MMQIWEDELLEVDQLVQQKQRPARKVPLEQNCALRRLLEVQAIILEQEDHIVFRKANTGRCTPNFAWREIVAQWCYDVADHLAEKRSVVYVAMNIVDRYCVWKDMNEEMSEGTYKLISMTAMFLAVRLSGSRELRLQEISSMSRGSIKIQDIISMGTCMIKHLSWDHQMVTPLDFVHTALESFPDSISTGRKQILLDSVRYLTELSVCDVHLSQCPPSELALAALLNSIQSQYCDELMAFARCLAADMTTEAADIPDMCRRLRDVYRESAENCRSNDTPHVVLDEDDHLDLRVQASCLPLGIVRSISDEDILESEPCKRRQNIAPAFRQVTRCKRAKFDLTTLA
jgi:hypothetical protein